MLFALVAGLTGGGASAQQAAVSDTQALGLAEALRVIAGHSEAAIAAGLDLDAAREGTKRLEALYRPSVSLTGGYMARDNPIVGLLGAFQASETERDFFSGELDATYLLWDGGRRSSAVEASRRGEDATSQRGSAEVQAAVLDGLGTYLRALAFSAQRDVVQQRITSLQDHLRIAQDLYDHGVVARNDLLETEVRLRLVQDQASQVDNGEAVAKQTLDRLMGRA
ncbi:MAG: TolC family protein, partial [Thermoanaerobaculales bacterium]